MQISRHALDSMQLLRQVTQLVPEAERLRGLDIASFHLGVGEQVRYWSGAAVKYANA